MKGALHRFRLRIEHRWTPAHASDYLDGELTARRCRRVERHARDCPECRELLRGLRLLIDTLGELREDRGGPLAAPILQSLRARLHEAPRDGA